MRNLIFVSLILMAALVACDEDNEEVIYINAGTIEKTDVSDFDIIVNLDNGKTLNPIKIYDNNNVENGDRVLVEYSIIKKTDDTTYDVNIYDINDILTKNIIQLTEKNKDSIGNDPVYSHTDGIWISNKHLNIVFDYYGYTETHFINLVRPIGETHNNKDQLILEFRHNANNDYPYHLLRGIVSFALDSLRVNDEDSVDFIVRVKNYSDMDFEWEGTYTFENNNQSILIKSQNYNLSKPSDFNIK